MKKIINLSLIFILIFSLLFSSGCTFGRKKVKLEEATDEVTTEVTREIYSDNPSWYIEFYSAEKQQYEYMSRREMAMYRSQYEDCNSTVYKSQLSGLPLLLYNCFLYAMENRLISFTVYVKDSDEDYTWIRELLSLDSPFLEQNYDQYEYISQRPGNEHGERLYIRTDQFGSEKWALKTEALEKCRSIVAEIPAEYETQLQKMEYLYDYVCDNVEYIDYTPSEDRNFLYDAVIKGKTNCDGYSNMLNLLFRLIGVEACEAMSTDKETKTGHTWVVAKIGDNFYNFDPTFEDTNEIDSTNRVYFGFSDSLTDTAKMEHGDFRPLCEDTSRDFLYAHAIAENLTDYEETDKIASVIKERKYDGIYETLFVVKTVLTEEHLSSFSETLLYTYGGFYSVKIRWFTEESYSIVIINVS